MHDINNPEITIGTFATTSTKKHFTKCNNAKCNSYYFVEPEQAPGDLGYLCPDCEAKSYDFHVVMCSSCKTVINFIGALKSEEKVVFTIDKCSHCVGTIEDEYEVEPLYTADSYI